MRPYWIRVDPKSNMTVVFIKKKIEDTETETHMEEHTIKKMEAEAGVMHLEAKEKSGLPPPFRG